MVDVKEFIVLALQLIDRSTSRESSDGLLLPRLLCMRRPPSHVLR